MRCAGSQPRSKDMSFVYESRIPTEHTIMVKNQINRQNPMLNDVTFSF